MKFYSGCLICGQELIYLDHAETQVCALCGQPAVSNARCAQGHFICDACHSADAGDLIERYCRETAESDPLQQALTLMRHPAIAMHGPEHHFLVPAVLLSAFYNQHPAENGEKAARIHEARLRSADIKGGSCGSCGTCGAAVGTGIFISLVTGATPLSGREWSLSNRMTAESLLSIAGYGGPRCCKRDTFLALQAAQAFVEERLEQSFSMQTQIRCEFSRFNRQCLGAACPFSVSGSIIQVTGRLGNRP